MPLTWGIVVPQTSMVGAFNRLRRRARVAARVVLLLVLVRQQRDATFLVRSPVRQFRNPRLP